MLDAHGVTHAGRVRPHNEDALLIDLPLGQEGVAGYAIDIEETEEQARQLRAFREAQRSMLDQLSIGVAQYAGSRKQFFQAADQALYRAKAAGKNCVMAEGDVETL